MPWSVIQIHPGASNRVERNLKRQGFEFWNPMVLDRSVHGGRWIERSLQLFPGYMFVNIVDRWRAIMSTIGVARLLMSESEKPAVLSSDFVDELRKSVDEGSGLVILSRREFVEGQSVEFVGGPMSSQVGTYEGQSGAGRVSVLMKKLGRVRVSPDGLIAVAT